MANARSGGPRRPDLDYYEYKRMHEQHLQQEGVPAVKPAAGKPVAEPAAPAASQTAERSAPVSTRAKAKTAQEQPARSVPPELDDALDFPEEDALDLPEEQTADQPVGKRSMFSGVKTLMKGVVHRLPEDEAEEHGEHRHHKEQEAPEPEPELEDEKAEMDDAPQIDNPIGDALIKVKGLFHKARTRLAERRPEKAGEDTEAEDSEEETQRPDDEQPESAASGGEMVLSRRMRKAAQARETVEEPPILDIEPVDVREVDELVSKPGTTVRAGFEDEKAPAPAAHEPSPEPDDETGDDDDDDDLPSARGTRLFGFFKKMRGRSAEPEAEMPPLNSTLPDGEGQSMDENQKAALTSRLSEELESTPSLSRKERKALAAGKQARASAPATPAAPAVPVAPAVPAVSETPAATMPFSAPTTAKTAYSVDEPTQEFHPLRTRAVRIAPAAPVELDDEEDEDADMPVRRAPKPPKPPKEKKRRVYQDEDLDDEEYDDDRYDERYEEDYDDYDDFDEDEDDERYDDEYHVSGGRRFLGFLKGLVVFILFLALCVLALRQLESSRVISLGGLRNAFGQISLILPSPAPEATAEPVETAPAEVVTAAPTAVPTPEPEPSIPAETPSADIAQVEPTAGTPN